MYTKAALDRVVVSIWQSRKGLKAAREARLISRLHYLPARASSSSAQGWISWHTFEQKALGAVLRTPVSITGRPMWHAARPSQHRPGPELFAYCVCPLCHKSHTWWWAKMKKKQSGTKDKWLVFHARRVMWTWGRRSWANCWLQSAAGFGSKYTHGPCIYLICSVNLGGEFIGLMLLSQSSSYMTSSKVRKGLFCL